jgi:tetratricopeptide (TPR) repeat protein
VGTRVECNAAALRSVDFRRTRSLDMIPVIRVFGAVVTLAVLLFVGGAARAGDPNAEKARAHFQQGDTYFKLDKYATALQEFEQAYLAKQDPSFLYNIAQCHRLMGNRVEAIRFYKRYLNDAPTAANRPVAEKHIRDLEAAIGAEELTGTHPAPPPSPPRSGDVAVTPTADGAAVAGAGDAATAAATIRRDAHQSAGRVPLASRRPSVLH